ncbi:5715_t:CDS:1 [Acaulospora colombiana]|uniref:5715_t:CDS:1 n=1 Tax=Acaulospora colombiana TaxID=27376 RepID=A0ACA9QH90_9GLOM|nr:5715_t:CDS:1 [Acaulospora colombiana]
MATSAPSTSTSTSETASSLRPHPFSTKAKPLDISAELIPNDNLFLTRSRLKNLFRTQSTQSLRKGVGLMPYLQRTLPPPSAHTLLSTYFARRGKGRIRPGSVLTVTLTQPPYTFSGVLMAVERKGPDSNILLRNVVRKTGVEMRIPLASPTLTGVKLIQRAGGSAVEEDDSAKARAIMKQQREERRKKRQEKKAAKAKAAGVSPITSTQGTSTSKTPKSHPVIPRRLRNRRLPSGWGIGMPGQVPTVRVARQHELIPETRRRVADAKETTKVEENGALTGKRMRRQRLYFLRDYPNKMSSISAGITKKDN